MMAIAKLEMKINLVDDKVDNKGDELTKKEQYIWYLLLPLLL